MTSQIGRATGRLRYWSVPLALAAAAAAAFAQTPVRSTADASSAGAIVLLVSEESAATTETLRRALKSDDAAVRRAAARVAAAAHAELFDDVRTALRAEQDPTVRAEFAKDLAGLGGAKAIALIEAEARKDDGPVTDEIIEWFARLDAERFVARLPEWSAAPAVNRLNLRDMVILAARRHATARDRILRAWLPLASENEWLSVLTNVFREKANDAARDGVLEAALASDRPSIREETIWFIVRLVALKHSMGAGPVSAALQPAAGSSEWAAFGRELIARMATKKHPDDYAAAVEHVVHERLEDVQWVWASNVLTRAERDTVRKRRGGDFQVSMEDRYSASMRTPEQLAAELLQSTLRAAGCRPVERQAPALVLSDFKSDGRPARIQIDRAGLTPGCEAAIVAIGRISTADSQDVSVEPQWLAIPLSRSFAACAAQSGMTAVKPWTLFNRENTQAQSPRLIKEVKPDYNRAAMEQRLEGVMILEIVISDSGCVRSARVVQSLGILDVKGMEAVLEWQFEPGRLQGTQVPVRADVELTFRLGGRRDGPPAR